MMMIFVSVKLTKDEAKSGDAKATKRAKLGEESFMIIVSM